MSFSQTDVAKIAHLARIALNEQDVAVYAENLSNIIELVEQMNSIDTTGIVPMAHPQDMAARMRDDVVTETDQRQLYQSIAPLTEAGLYLVLKVIE
jgi:aspartyl-tRNA(Asn)/glutamyl-tRNA(Gln) amidotransferase subunit C